MPLDNVRNVVLVSPDLYTLNPTRRPQNPH